MDSRTNFIAHCTIVWKDDNILSEYDVDIAVGNIDVIDSYIFFYCENKEELDHLLDYDNGEDFYITEYIIEDYNERL